MKTEKLNHTLHCLFRQTESGNMIWTPAPAGHVGYFEPFTLKVNHDAAGIHSLELSSPATDKRGAGLMTVELGRSVDAANTKVIIDNLLSIVTTAEQSELGKSRSIALANLDAAIQENGAELSCR